MTHCDLSAAKQQHRRETAVRTRKMVLTQLTAAEEDGASLMTDYHGYFLQISFSELHPLMVFCLAKALAKPSTAKQRTGWILRWNHSVFLRFLTGASMRQTAGLVSLQDRRCIPAVCIV